MSVIISYSLLLIVVNIICVMGLRYFGLAFIYNEAYRMFGAGFSTALSVTLILLVITCSISYFIVKPFDDLLKKIKKENYIPSNEELEKCLSCYKRLNTSSVVAAILGFFVGQIIMTIIGVKNGLYDSDSLRIGITLNQAFGFGLVSAISMINGLDSALVKYREQLHLRSIDGFQRQRSMKISVSIIFTIAICLYFTASNMFSVMYGSFILDAQITFMKKGIVCFFFSLLYCLYPISVIIRNLVTRINTTSKALDDIASKKDLSKRIDITMLDDFGTLTTSINTTMETFSLMIKELSEKTNIVSESANVISDTAVTATSALEQMTSSISKINLNSANQNELIIEADKNILELANSVENIKKHAVEQSNSVENISSSITEMTANIASVTDTARRAQITSDELTQTSSSGRQSIEDAIVTMNAISESSEEVQEIVKLIQDIAEQTNLLSMNAAIEAAHAGQYGQGFAVVADEVRNLAESSSQSAQDIQTHISEMIEKIKLGVERINAAGTYFNEISSKVETNAQFVNMIFAAMEEQSIGAKETQESTVRVVEAVQAVNDLTKKETEAAQKVRDFMKTVVSASNSTMAAIDESVDATENLKSSVAKFDKHAIENKKSVVVIQNQIENFKI